LPFSEGVTRHKIKDQTTEFKMRISLKYFSLVSKACTDLSEQKNRLPVQEFSDQLSFHYRGANEMVEALHSKLLKDSKAPS